VSPAGGIPRRCATSPTTSSRSSTPRRCALRARRALGAARALRARGVAAARRRAAHRPRPGARRGRAARRVRVGVDARGELRPPARGAARGWIHSIVRHRALDVVRSGARMVGVDGEAAEALASALELRSRLGRLAHCLQALEHPRRVRRRLLAPRDRRAARDAARHRQGLDPARADRAAGVHGMSAAPDREGPEDLDALAAEYVSARGRPSVAPRGRRAWAGGANCASGAASPPRASRPRCCSRPRSRCACRRRRAASSCWSRRRTSRRAGSCAPAAAASSSSRRPGAPRCPRSARCSSGPRATTGRARCR